MLVPVPLRRSLLDLLLRLRLVHLVPLPLVFCRTSGGSPRGTSAASLSGASGSGTSGASGSVDFGASVFGPGVGGT